MTQAIDSTNLVDFDEVCASAIPIARLTLEPSQIAHMTALEFIQGFDGLDYLVFAAIELGPMQRSYLVKHRNAPEAGMLIYLVPEKEKIATLLSQTLSHIKLERENLDWLNPDFINEIGQTP